jgi:hypothetical protein
VQTGPNGAASVNAGGVKVQTGPGGGTKVVVPGMGTVTTPVIVWGAGLAGRTRCGPHENPRPPPTPQRGRGQRFTMRTTVVSAPGAGSDASVSIQ